MKTIHSCACKDFQIVLEGLRGEGTVAKLCRPVQGDCC